MNRTITPRLGDVNTPQKNGEATFSSAFYLALLALCAGGTFWYWRQWDHDDGFIVFEKCSIQTLSSRVTLNHGETLASIDHRTD